MQNNQVREWLNEMGIVVSTMERNDFGGADALPSRETADDCGDRAA